MLWKMIFGRRYLSSNWKAPTCRILRLIEYLRSCRLVGICMRNTVLLQCIALQRIQIRNYSCERANPLIDLSFSWSSIRNANIIIIYTGYLGNDLQDHQNKKIWFFNWHICYAASLHPFLLLWVVTLTWGSLFVVIDLMGHGHYKRS